MAMCATSIDVRQPRFRRDDDCVTDRRYSRGCVWNTSAFRQLPEYTGACAPNPWISRSPTVFAYLLVGDGRVADCGDTDSWPLPSVTKLAGTKYRFHFPIADAGHRQQWVRLREDEATRLVCFVSEASHLRGLIHLTLGNLAKSLSVDISSQPCCTASAARCASDMRFPSACPSISKG
jgi:hypothetical protein